MAVCANGGVEPEQHRDGQLRDESELGAKELPATEIQVDQREQIVAAECQSWHSAG